MVDNEDLDAEDFIPGQEDETEDIDIHELLFRELNELLANETSENPAVTCWLIGERLRRTLGIIQDEKKAKKAFDGLQIQISERFGQKFTHEKLYECLKLADEFPDLSIFSEYTESLSLEHFLELLSVESDMARTFYCEMCKMEKWSVSQLKEKIDNKAFEAEYGE